jgi:GNAT superfamily N-acetyltransferase
MTRDPIMNASPARDIEIVPFRAGLSLAFASLNRAWIEQLFRIEDADLKVLTDPETAIIKPGGQIFFAMRGAEAVGTVAVVRKGADTCELAKMAVTPAWQGRGVGERLGHAAIAWARASSAAVLFLETNSALAGAIRLYERLGFRHAAPPSPSEYARSDVYMEIRFR